MQLICQHAVNQTPTANKNETQTTKEIMKPNCTAITNAKATGWINPHSCHIPPHSEALSTDLFLCLANSPNQPTRNDKMMMDVLLR